MECRHLVFTGHALRRMFERGIGVADVRSVVDAGVAIEDYPDDEPFPSSLLHAIVGGSSIHVVVAADPESDTCYVITVYWPDPDLWDDGGRRRRP